MGLGLKNMTQFPYDDIFLFKFTMARSEKCFQPYSSVQENATPNVILYINSEPSTTQRYSIMQY